MHVRSGGVRVVDDFDLGVGVAVQLLDERERRQHVGDDHQFDAQALRVVGDGPGEVAGA